MFFSQIILFGKNNVNEARPTQLTISLQSNAAIDLSFVVQPRYCTFCSGERCHSYQGAVNKASNCSDSLFPFTVDFLYPLLSPFDLAHSPWRREVAIPLEKQPINKPRK